MHVDPQVCLVGLPAICQLYRGMAVYAVVLRQHETGQSHDGIVYRTRKLADACRGFNHADALLAKLATIVQL